MLRALYFYLRDVSANSGPEMYFRWGLCITRSTTHTPHLNVASLRAEGVFRGVSVAADGRNRVEQVRRPPNIENTRCGSLDAPSRNRDFPACAHIMQDFFPCKTHSLPALSR